LGYGRWCADYSCVSVDKYSAGMDGAGKFDLLFYLADYQGAD
jgi:hypothetical protein